MMRSHRRLLPCLALALLAAACGSPVGDGPNDAVDPGPDTVADVPDAVADAPDAADGGPGDASADLPTDGPGPDTPADVPADLPPAAVPVCNDGVREGYEWCDRDDLAGATCESLGYAAGGSLACDGTCAFDVRGCAGDWTCPADPGEPNAGWEQATPLAPGLVDGALCGAPGAPDEDWYVFPTPPAGRKDVLVLVTNPAVGRLEGQVWARTSGTPDPNFYASVSGSDQNPWWAWDDQTARPDEAFLRVFWGGGPVQAPYRVLYRDDVECLPGARAERQCPAGQHCEAGDLSFACRAGCVVESDCGEGERCRSDGACSADGCATHDDCPAGQGCTWEGSCVSAACGPGQECGALDGLWVCDPGKGYCVQCLTPLDCPFSSDATCLDGKCGIDCPEDAYEPNDTPGTATPVDLAAGPFHADLSFCTDDVDDHFAFTMPAFGTFILTLNVPGTPSDVVVELRRDNGKLVSEQLIAQAGDGEAALLYLLGAGSYVAALRALQDPGQPDAAFGYTLTLEAGDAECTDTGVCGPGKGCRLFRCVDALCTFDAHCAAYGLACDEGTGLCAPCGVDDDCHSLEACVDHRCEPACTDDAYEPNDDKAAAAPLAPGNHDLELCKARGGTEEDWFRVDLLAGQGVTAVLQARRGPRNDFPDEGLKVDLLLENGTEVPAGGDTGMTPPFYTATTAQAVYLRVRAVAGNPDQSSWGPHLYRLSVAVDPGCLGSPWESDCPSGTICSYDSFTCVTGCVSSARDCDAGELCLGFACQVPVCTRHADCPVGQACFQTRCDAGPACDEDYDCTASPYAASLGLRACDTGLGRCVECAKDADCTSGVDTCVDGACVFPCAEDGHEPNDTQEAATPMVLGTWPGLGLCVPPAQSLPMGFPREEDWYAVDVQAGDVLAAGIDTLDLDLVVVLQDGRWVHQAGNGGDGWQYKVHRATAAGRLWVRVALPTHLQWGATPYDLDLRLAECAVDRDCGPGGYCRGLACVDTTCATDDECLFGTYGKRCDPGEGHCVDCLGDPDCTLMGESCLAGRCGVDCAADAYAPSSLPSSAVPVDLPFSAAGLTLCGSWDQDFFRMDLKEGRTYRFRLSAAQSPPPMGMGLYTGTDANPLSMFEEAPAESAPGGLELVYTLSSRHFDRWLLRVWNRGDQPTGIYDVTADEVF